MKKYIIIAIIFIALFAVCFGIGMYAYRINNISGTKIEQITQVSESKITDECTDEFEQLQILQANSREEKISPTATLILKKYYKECGHTIKDYTDVPKELVNMDKTAIEEEYKDWIIENFSPNEIILQKEEDGICNEHYMLREKDNVIEIYSIDETGMETLKEKTEINTIYLPETDIINLRNGVRVNGKEALNSILQDYE